MNFCGIFELLDVALFSFAGKLLGRDILGGILLAADTSADTTEDVVFSIPVTSTGFNTGTSAKFSTTELGIVETRSLVSSHF